MVAYVVERLDPVALTSSEPLRSMDWMSPFVWREADRLRMMMRGVPAPLRPGDLTGLIWHGESADGLNFTMDDRPAIMPGLPEHDDGGVEDPTVQIVPGGLMVFYTGVDVNRHQGCLLVATGTSVDTLITRELLLKAPKGQGNIKEATLAQASDGSWRLFYEFAREDSSRIGLASAPGLGGEWTPLSEPIPIRPEAWDNWHLSTGPIVSLPGRDPVMFYNGATADARWRIGWVTFDADFARITDRSVEPMLMPPPATDRNAVDIAFAASALITERGTIDLYYSLEDRILSRAIVAVYD